MHVLVVTYYFPPADFGSTNRLFRLVPDLSQAGVSFCALTVNRGDLRTHNDATLLDGLKYFHCVERTRSFEPFRSWDTKVASMQHGSVANSSHPAATSNGERGRLWLGTIRPLSLFLRQITSIPDSGVGWYPFALHRALRMCRDHKFDLIFSTIPSQTAHLVASTLARKTGLPWVADFRDSWFDYGREYRMPERTIQARMLDNIIRRSDAMTFTSQVMYEKVCDENPGIRRKFHFVPHGIAVIPQFPPFEKDPGEFWLSFIGSMDHLRDPRPFLTVLATLKAKYPEAYAKVRVKIVGTVTRDMRRVIDMSNVSEQFEYIGFVPRNESIRWMQSSDLLLILLSEKEGIGYGASASKVYDYLATRKPILAIVPEGNVSRLITETSSGRSFTLEQQQECATWLARVITGQETTRPHEERLASLSVHAIAEKLRSVFETAVKRRHASGFVSRTHHAHV